ncbi:uncharacterized protein LOC109728471 isoform X7 [Ananas comosus]|uniref:DNA repair protein REV1 n=1 Tax=Ananas comosus TaxID=4615 RepID=A0A6P5HKB7_ANACO|nr:uncharacterized protein LOC109728471 isoform X7 [Ananas comosus]
MLQFHASFFPDLAQVRTARVTMSSLEGRHPSSAATISSSLGDSRKRGRPDSARRNPRKRNSSFADFGSYMAEKNRKLRDQFETDASTSSADGRGIFRGISIFVDGFTIPSSQELKEFMLKHGGGFVNYFSRHTVTHIICGNLPDSKMKNLRAFSRGLPVVRPAWLVDSIAANKLLSWFPYQLSDGVNERCKQQKLSTFFTQKSISNSKNVETSADQQGTVGLEGSSSNDEVPKNIISYAQLQASTDEGQDSEEFGCYESEIDFDAKSVEANDAVYAISCSVLGAFDSSKPHIHNTSCCGNTKEEILDTKGAKASNMPHSTLTDPKFVENYFKNSRLHFIGIWRNRYRQHFSDFLCGAKSSNANIDSLSDRKKTIIVHIDMDCFFVSVVIRNFRDLFNKPVAVSHSDSLNGTAEISSANYPARDYGVKAGMFVRDAKACCPHLVIVPYNFEAYEEVADQFYSILHKYCNKVQAISCDEAFLDMTECSRDDPRKLALMIREEISKKTRCTASAGIADNMLLARLATRSAKPNGQCFIPSEKVRDFLNDLPVKALPGIGHSLDEKLKSRQIQSCGQLQKISKEELQNEFGKMTGDMLWSYCRGIDNRAVKTVQETKSVGAEVNWGVRFNDNTDFENFLVNLCKEVSLRLQGCRVQGRTVTLKVKKRRKGAEEPAKFLGCGDCETMSRSMTIPVATDDLISLRRISKQIFVSFHIGFEENAIKSWLASPSEKVMKQSNKIASSLKKGNNEGLPPLCSLDVEVVKYLPPEIISEINDIYMGELHHFMEAHEDENRSIKSCKRTISLPEQGDNSLASSGQAAISDVGGHTAYELNDSVAGPLKKGKLPGGYSAVAISSISTQRKMTKERKQVETPYAFCSRSNELGSNLPRSNENMDLMPGSWSQADISILQQLPEDVRTDSYELTPQRARISNDSYDLTSELLKSSGNQNLKCSKISLFSGSPPKWVEKFKVSNCLILNVIAEFYAKSRADALLSSILQSVISFLPLASEKSSEERDEAISCLCELLTQYIILKIESDIEELYNCFCLLKRFSSVSKLFLEVHKGVFPFLQASTDAYYGGNFYLPIVE